MIALAEIDGVIESYCDRVLSGEQVAGKYGRAAVERYRRDLGRVGDPDFPYEFHRQKARGFCSFFPKVLKHWKGEWAGLPFELSDWQAFVIWNLYGWVQKGDGLRRFRRAYISVGRKNGKSFLAAGIGLIGLHLDNEAGAEVYVGATKLDQAKVIYRDAVSMTQAAPDLGKRSKVYRAVGQERIWVERSQSIFKPIASDRPCDGFNPSSVLMDELHAWREEHRPFWRTITTGSGARRQPLFAMVTTAGDDQSAIWKQEVQHAERVSTGEIQDERTFAFVARLDDADDPFDESKWEKANPNLGVSVKLEYLRSQAEQAKLKPDERDTFIRYHCNREVSSRCKPLSPQAWAKCAGELTGWDKAEAIGIGVDLGGRDDLASWAVCGRFPLDDGRFRYEVRQWSYLYDRTKRDTTQQPFASWVWDGRIKLSRTVIADIQDATMAFALENGCTGFAFDPYNSRQLGDTLEAAGLPVIAMPQNCMQFNEPLKELFAAIADGRLRHDGDPVLSWAAGNLVIYRNSKDQIMPDKGAAEEKIDPIVAATMAFRCAYFAPGNASTYYATNPVEMQ